MTILLIFLTVLAILSMITTVVAIHRDGAVISPPRSHPADDFGTPLSS